MGAFVFTGIEFFSVKPYKFMLMAVYCFVFLYSQTALYGQKIERYVINTSGGYSETNGFNIDSNVGELFTKTLNDSTNSVTEGFLQPDEYILLSVEDQVETTKVSVYPNPFNSTLSIICNHDLISPCVSIFDCSGKLVYKEQLTNQVSGNSVFLTLPWLSEGVYFLYLTATNIIGMQYKLIKI